MEVPYIKPHGGYMHALLYQDIKLKNTLLQLTYFAEIWFVAFISKYNSVAKSVYLWYCLWPAMMIYIQNIKLQKYGLEPKN